MTKQDAESDEQKQIHNEQVRLLMKRKREAEKLAKKIKLHSKTEEHKDDMEDVISWSKKEALKFLHRTKDLKNPHKHRL